MQHKKLKDMQKRYYTLWERLRCDVKEELLWDAKKHPSTKEIINFMMKEYFFINIPIIMVLSIYEAKYGCTGVMIDVVKFYNLFTDGYGKN